MKTIAIDFDGVIHRYSKGWNDGTCYDEPMEGAVNSIYELQKQGYAVFILSTRKPQQIIEWFQKVWGKGEALFSVVEIPENTVFWNEQWKVGVTNRKLPAVVYIDDRAFLFESWKKTLDSLNNSTDQKKP